MVRQKGEMKRRVGSRRPVKEQRCATKRKPRKGRVAPAPAADLTEQVATLTLELKEARAHQAATGEILASLTGSITDAKPVFDAIVRNLQRLFDTRLSMVQLLKDGVQYLAAAGDEEYDRLARNFPRPLDYETGSGRAILAKRVIQFAPVLGNPEAPVVHQQFARELGFNSSILAPMVHDDRVIGVISTARREAKPFDDREIALIKAFADQAVIAIENTQLLNELRQRTDDLSESLEQQTATSEVLRVISSSPGTLEPVFQIMLENATRLCEAQYGVLFLWEGDGKYRVGALHGASPRLAEERRPGTIIRPAPSTVITRIAETKRTAQENDIQAKAAYVDPPPGYMAAGIALHGGARTELGVPMLKDDKLIGALVIYRREGAALYRQTDGLACQFRGAGRHRH